MNRVLTGAVDIGGTKIQVGIVDESGNLLADKCFPTDCRCQSAEQAMDRVIELLQVQCRKLGLQLTGLRGIGVACSGPVNLDTGSVENPYTLPGWMGFPIVEYLSAHTGLEVKLENDANGALLGEVYQRKLMDHKVLMLTFGTGIGVAFWNGKALYRSGKYHPEMGHVIVSSRDTECYCGHKGCFESCCSGKALNERAKAAGYEDFDDLYGRAQEKEKGAVMLTEEIVQDLKNGIWSLNIIFKPDTIILAGGFSRKHFAMIRDAVAEDSAGKEDFLDRFEILPACENKNSALVGANMLFMKG